MLQKTKVLIIGAGPTGLMAAIQLRRQGLEPVIIDKKEGPTRESRALVLHARSLEIYDQLGIANEALLKGEIVQKVQFIVKGKKVQDMTLNRIGEGASPFPFLLVLEQSKNEELLYTYLKKLGGDVAWETEMISMLQEEERTIVAVKRDGEMWDIDADFVIAADGGTSAVRHALDIPFLGATYEQIFYVADTAIEWPWGSDALSLAVSRQSFMGLFPMQGKDRFRVIGVLPASLGVDCPESFDAVAPIIEKEMGIPLRFSDTSWFSVYKLHHRCIEHFRKGNVFFAGDAAHIHSPAGGQGMNTGLQDAYNLAWKMAMVVKGIGSNTLLDTYEQERLPFAKSLIASTDRMFSIMTSPKWFHRLFRLGVLPHLLSVLIRFKKFRKRAFHTVSQIGIKYIDSDLTINRILQPMVLKAGERFPYLLKKDGSSIYHTMKNPVFHAIVFPGPGSKLVRGMKGVEADLGRLMQVHDFSEEEGLRKSLGIKSDVVILVRPDHYIGLITDEGPKVVGDYIRRLSIEKKEEGILLTKTHQ